MSPTTLRCRFCSWTTTKWSRDQTPDKAFRRLRTHIADCHWEEDERIERETLLSMVKEEDLIRDIWGDDSRT